MTKIQDSITIRVALVEGLLEDLEVVARRKLNEKFKEIGLPDGVRVQVTINPDKYGYDVIAQWDKLPSAPSGAASHQAAEVGEAR